jgi:p-methyltransferase
MSAPAAAVAGKPAAAKGPARRRPRQRLDCVLVGYAESTPRDDLALALEVPDEDLPPPIRSLLRTTISLGGEHYGYLEGMSAARAQAGHDGGKFTVSELPSLGTLYLANYLEARGRSAAFVNSFTYERDELDRLLAEHPRSVAVTTTFYVTPGPVIEIVRHVRAHDPTVPIIVGGPLIDNYCRAGLGPALDRVLDRIGADVYVWESQGEATLHGVVTALVEGTDVAAVPNTLLRETDGWRLSSRRPESNDLDECAVHWRRFSEAGIGPTLSLRTARSCAFSCAFCDYPERAGALALATIDTVEHELETLAEMGVRRVAFVDDTFNVPVRRFEELLRMMVRRDFGIEWFSYFRCGQAKQESIYDLMVESGCRGVLLGIESGDNRVLKAMNKKATVEHYRFGIEQLHAHGIFTHASFVIGFPGETDETIENTIGFLQSTRPDTFAVNHWYYLHSTPIHLRAKEYELTGEGHTWSHSTMDSRHALDCADRIFREVDGVAWMPVTDLDFWGVPYLFGKGMSPGEVLRFLELAKPLTVAAAARTAPEALAAGEQEFRTFCTGLDLAPARYGDVAAVGR